MIQDQMWRLYGKAPSGISMHIKKLYEDGELKEQSTSQSESKFSNSENTMQNPENSFKKPKKYYIL